MLSIQNAMTAFRRSPLLSALSVTTIAFSLFAFGLFGLVALNIRDALQHIEERVEIRAFIADGTSIEMITSVADQVAKYPEVLKVDIVTQEQALARARKELGEFSDVFDAQFLPASLDVRLKVGKRDPATVRSVVDRMRGFEFIDDIRFGEEWITQLYRLRNIAGAAGITLGLAFAAVAVIIIGATDGFIRRPFLIEGSIKGVLGGLLALALTYVAMRLLEQYLHFDTAFFDRRLATLGVVFGALMGLIGSAVSVGRHLRRVGS